MMKGGWGEREKKEEHGVAKAVEKGLSPRVQALWAFLSELDNHGCLTLVTTRAPDHISLSPSI